MRRYRLRGEQNKGFLRPEGMPSALHRLLISRGIRSVEEAERFLHPGITDLNDPMLLSDMDFAVERIHYAMAHGQRIAVWGDYDVDGVCATAILTLCLKAHGASVEPHIPSRHEDGYGLNEAGIRELAQRNQLMITVDCGITNAPLVALAEELGMSVVVTDHHRPGDALPACPTVNPLLNGYPFPYLCGAGVAFQLAAALFGREEAMRYIDLTALATVADVVSLTEENRAIVRMGLQAIDERPRAGVSALIRSAGLEDKVITAGNIAFQIAPRLNAGGRIGSANTPLQLLMEEDIDRADALAETLEKANTERKALEAQILQEAERQLTAFDFLEHRAVVLMGDSWNPGVIGLAASRIVEKYHYPTILLAAHGEFYVGSCRSIEGVDIHQALTAVQRHFERFGGHKQAAGLTIHRDRVSAFIRDLDAYLSENIPPDTYIPEDAYDLDVDFDELGDVFVESLEGMQPTGMGAPAPLFRAEAEVREARAVGREGAHLKLKLLKQSTLLDGIAFQQGGLAETLHGKADLLFTPKINEYMGRRSVQLEVKCLTAPDNASVLRASEKRLPTLLSNFLTDILYNREYIDREILPTDRAGEILDALPTRVQGTLLIAGGLDTAEAFVEAHPGIPMDVTIGAYPQDRRAFTCLAVLPTGQPPRAYRNALLLGLPFNPADGIPAAHLPGIAPQWVQSLPDIDALREAYKALRRMTARPVYLRSLEGLVTALSEEAGMDAVGAYASLLALHDMRLIRLQLSGARAEMTVLPMARTDPMSSQVFRRITSLKTQKMEV